MSVDGPSLPASGFGRSINTSAPVRSFRDLQVTSRFWAIRVESNRKTRMIVASACFMDLDYVSLFHVCNAALADKHAGFSLDSNRQSLSIARFHVRYSGLVEHHFSEAPFSGASGCEAQLAEGSRYDLTVAAMMDQYVAAAALFLESAVERGIGVTVPPRGELAFRWSRGEKTHRFFHGGPLGSCPFAIIVRGGTSCDGFSWYPHS
jgi:hypothetical protein